MKTWKKTKRYTADRRAAEAATAEAVATVISGLSTFCIFVNQCLCAENPAWQLSCPASCSNYCCMVQRLLLQGSCVVCQQYSQPARPNLCWPKQAGVTPLASDCLAWGGRNNNNISGKMKKIGVLTLQSMAFKDTTFSTNFPPERVTFNALPDCSTTSMRLRP